MKKIILVFFIFSFLYAEEAKQTKTKEFSPEFKAEFKNHVVAIGDSINAAFAKFFAMHSEDIHRKYLYVPDKKYAIWLKVRLAVDDKINISHVQKLLNETIAEEINSTGHNIQEEFKIKYDLNPEERKVGHRHSNLFSKLREGALSSDGKSYKGALYFGYLHLRVNCKKETDKLHAFFDEISLKIERNYPKGNEFTTSLEDLGEIIGKSPAIRIDYTSRPTDFHEPLSLVNKHIEFEDYYIKEKQKMLGQNPFKRRLEFDMHYQQILRGTGNFSARAMSTYFTGFGIERSKAMIDNYLTQPDIVLTRQEGSNWRQLTSDQEVQFKYDLHQYLGSRRKSEIRYTYRDTNGRERMPLLPGNMQEQFSKVGEKLYYFEPSMILPKYFHWLATKAGQIRGITLYPEKSLQYYDETLDRFLSKPPRYRRIPIILDVLKFMADYGTAITLSDYTSIDMAWLDVAVRSYLTGNEVRKKAVGEQIASDIWNLTRKYNVSVSFHANENSVKFFVLDTALSHSKEITIVGTEQEFNGLDIVNKVAFIMAATLKQHWFNFYKHKAELHYVDVADVDFYMSVFNIQRAMEVLDSSFVITDKNLQHLSKKSVEDSLVDQLKSLRNPDSIYLGRQGFLEKVNKSLGHEVGEHDQDKLFEAFYLKKHKYFKEIECFGLWGYLQHLFSRNKDHEILNEFKIVKDILDVKITFQKGKDRFFSDLRKIQKKLDDDKNRDRLLAFFATEEYEVMHLDFNPYHQVFIQIIGSHTRHNKLWFPGEKQRYDDDTLYTILGWQNE